MSFKFICGGCGKKIKAPDKAAGRGVRCPGCGHEQIAVNPDAPAGDPTATGGGADDALAALAAATGGATPEQTDDRTTSHDRVDQPFPGASSSRSAPPPPPPPSAPPPPPNATRPQRDAAAEHHPTPQADADADVPVAMLDESDDEADADPAPSEEATTASVSDEATTVSAANQPVRSSEHRAKTSAVSATDDESSTSLENIPDISELMSDDEVSSDAGDDYETVDAPEPFEVPAAASAPSPAAPSAAAPSPAEPKKARAIPMFQCASCAQIFPAEHVIEEDGVTLCKHCYRAPAVAAAPAGHSPRPRAAKKSKMPAVLIGVGAVVLVAVVGLLVAMSGGPDPAEAKLPAAALPAAFEAPAPNPDNVNRANRGIVRVNVFLEVRVASNNVLLGIQQLQRGSGFFVKNDTSLITNHHVIDVPEELDVEVRGGRISLQRDADDKWKGTVQTPDGEEIGIVAERILKVQLKDDTELKGKLIAQNEKLDLAVLRLTMRNAMEFHNLPVLNLASGMPGEGDTVYSMGTPAGAAANSTHRGEVTGFTKYFMDDSIDVIQASAHTAPGSSGGALVSQDGEVEGVTTYINRVFKDDEERTILNFAMPAERVVGFLQEAGVNVEAKPRLSDAWKAVADEKWSDAVKMLETLTDRRSFQRNNPYAHLALGYAQYQLQEYGEAKAAYEEALLSLKDDDPRYADARYALGYMLQQLGDYETAVQHFDYALKARPSHTAAEYAKAVSLHARGEHEDAIALLKKLAEKDSGGEDGRRAKDALEAMGVEI